ncbi:GTP 3',8-cyclase isoform X1 [Aricia agestis]|uniref:GTP 3',8-cyclase isoform X1 n=1 Tax=Aricia agestis TaxID=91739 RepID=UPI001C203E19|nr:GTP 3',8-cyclase isoform X1 [Aricia agestis]
MYSLRIVQNVLQKKLHLKLSAPVLGGLRQTSHSHDKSRELEPPNADATTETLMDLHGRRHDYLRISLTERCNLRCQYCMPAEGVSLSPRARLLSFAELMRLARVFAALGVGKVRLTGGEPTLRADLEEVVRALRGLPGVRTVAMTSNGLALARRLPALQRAGLTHLNLSLDTLRADRFERMTRRPGLAKVLACIDVALQIGIRPLKINTVLMKGFNDDEVGDFVEFTREREVEVRDEERRHSPGLQPAYDPHRRVAACGRRAYCTAAGGGSDEAGPRLTHVDGEGRARMVDVGGKAETERAAEAECYVRVNAAVARLLRAGGGGKGDAAGAARLAGVMAAKRTADLIPLCHQLPLSAVRVRVELPGEEGGAVRVTCEARTRARTGVEMEALTGCAVAALTLYDMCKAADRHMRVSGLRVTRKSGGRSGDWTAPDLDPDDA